MSHGPLRYQQRSQRRGFIPFSARVIAPAISMLVVATVARADAMRCGKWVVNESTSVGELLGKCGEPQSKDVTKEDIYMTNVNGLRVKTGDITVTERWTYQPSPRSLPMVVTIIDGKIVSLTRAR